LCAPSNSVRMYMPAAPSCTGFGGTCHVLPHVQVVQALVQKGASAAVLNR
jgi:hypothetical protein